MTHSTRSQRTRTGQAHRNDRKRKRNVWHVAFASFLVAIAPKNFDVFTEVALSVDPPRADFILLRRKTSTPRRALSFCGLWDRLGRVTVLEYKSPAKSSFRQGDLVRLLCYGTIYHARHPKKSLRCDELTLVLVVASITPTLLAEIAQMGWTLTPLGGGYFRVDGVMYPCYVAVIDDVCQEERDELLRLFSHLPVADEGTKAWLSQWMKDNNMKLPRKFTKTELKEFRRLAMKRFPIEDRLEGMTPEQRMGGLAPHERMNGLAPHERMNGLAPHERLDGLTPEDVVANLPIEVLRGLSEPYVRSLPSGVQRKVRRRLREAEATSPATKPRRTAVKTTSTSRATRSKSAD